MDNARHYNCGVAMVPWTFGAHAKIWLAVLWPWRVEQAGLFLVTLIMFAYVVMGLWRASGKLEAASYLAVRKAFVGRKPKTFLRLTRTGRRAFEEYVEALRNVLANAPDAEGKFADRGK